MNDNCMNRFLIATLLGVALISETKAQAPQPVLPRTAPSGQFAQPGQVGRGQVDLPKFDLQFAGGKPAQLVEVINAELGGTLNVVLPKEAEEVEIPAMRLKDVNVSQVFDALSHISQKQVAYETTQMVQQGGGFAARPGTQYYNQYYGFRTDGPITENSVWYFFLERPSGLQSAKTCKYYQLGAFLTQYKIEDITTAIKTGWDMLGVKGESVPQLKFHQDTKLLVAVGDPAKLFLIDDVLNELRKAPAPAPTGQPPSEQHNAKEKS
jgi:hypothetical protein